MSRKLRIEYPGVMYHVMYVKGSVPESVKQGWQGGELGAGRRRDHGQEGIGAGPPAQSNRMKSSTLMSVCRRMARKVPRSISRCAGTTVCANGLSRLIMIWLRFTFTKVSMRISCLR